MAKKKKKKKRAPSKEWIGNKNLPIILSIIAILISLGQLIFTVPFVLRYFDNVELETVEYDLEKLVDENYVTTSFQITNTGHNTAENVELHLRVLKNDKILFVPEVFNLVKDDKKGGIAKNLIFNCNEIVPKEKVKIFIFSNYEEYLERNLLDTLIYNQSVPRPIISYGPYITTLKHKLGKVDIDQSPYLTLVE